MNDRIGSTRRDCLRLLGLGLVTVGAGVGCKKGEEAVVCTDTSSMAPGDVKLREILGYVDQSPEPTKRCDNCVQFTPPTQKGCGTCKLFRGPANPKGYCKSWAQKT